MSLNVPSCNLSGMLPKIAMLTALAAVFIVAGPRMAAAQGETRQIQVLPAPGAQVPTANAAPANAAATPDDAAPAQAAPTEDAPPPQRRRPRRQQQAAPEPAEDTPPVAAVPADEPPSAEKAAPFKPVVDKPLKAKPVAKPKPRYYHERDYGYRPRYERGGYDDGYRGYYGGGSRY